MLDSNLPTYFYRPSTDRSHRYDYSLLFTQNDSDPDPRYTLRFPDPWAPIAQNVYACALYDAFVTEVLFGEILLRPDWSQPTLSAQEIRQNVGVPPAPVPLVPPEFHIQLYNPDQQVVVTEKQASWGGNSYHFNMPQYTFRMPSGSTLDRGTHDPSADSTTPQLKFVWRKEGKLTNNMACFLTGKTTDTNQKKKGGKEPDILIAILHNYRDLTLYESNFHRVEMEDYKGLEIVLLLGASVIRDVYCGQKKNAFNVGDPNERKSSGGFLGKKKSIPLLGGNANASQSTLRLNPTPPAANNNARLPPPAIPPRTGPVPLLQSNGLPISGPNGSHGRSTSHPNNPYQWSSGAGAPAPDPREQWQIDAESARLRRQNEEDQRQAEVRRREQERADAVEAKKIKKMLDAEDKQRRKKEAEIEKETERLRKLYGDQSNLLAPRLPSGKPARTGQPGNFYANPGASATSASLLKPKANVGNSLLSPSYLQPSGPYGGPSRPAASQSSFFHGPSSAPLHRPAAYQGQQPQPQPQAKPKKSMLGLRRRSEDGNALKTKKSSLW